MKQFLIKLKILYKSKSLAALPLHCTNRSTTKAVMEKFWKEHSTKSDVTDMMLDHDAFKTSDLDKQEILSKMPDVTGKKVLELGAGIGRFTGDLASKCDRLVAVDFMQTFIDKNKETNYHRTNVSYIADNVMNLSFPPGSFDVVFSNWLLMYLSDQEIKTLFSRVLHWLTPNGCLFFRESCLHQSGNKRGEYNPTIYRSQEDYERLLQTTKNEARLQITFCSNSKTYQEMKNNKNQIIWSAKKIVSRESRSGDF